MQNASFGADSASTPTLPPTVLIVDDDEVTLELLRQVVERDGYRCLTSGDGQSALTLYLTHDVSVALVDLELPDVSGIELLRLFRAERQWVPVMLMTGNPSQKAMMEAAEAGAYTFLTKPLDLLGLRRLLAKSRTATPSYQLTMSRVEVKRSSVFIRWSRWIVGKD